MVWAPTQAVSFLDLVAAKVRVLVFFQILKVVLGFAAEHRAGADSGRTGGDEGKGGTD